MSVCILGHSLLKAVVISMKLALHRLISLNLRKIIFCRKLFLRLICLIGDITYLQITLILFLGSSLTEAGYDHFSEGQPDNTSSGQYCGGMFRSGRLNDVWCHRRGPFICEKSPDSLNADDDPLK